MNEINKHEDSSCNCHSAESRFGCEQTLDELDFEKSIFGCAVYGDLQRLKQLISKKGSACLNDQDRNGYTCLHYAARHSRVDICKYIILQANRGDVDVNLKTKSCGSTPLHRACYVGCARIVELLMSSGARGDEQDCDGKTPLHKCVEQMVGGGANSSAKEMEFRECAKILVEKAGPQIVNIKDSSGKSPVDIFPTLLEIIK